MPVLSADVVVIAHENGARREERFIIDLPFGPGLTPVYTLAEVGIRFVVFFRCFCGRSTLHTDALRMGLR